MLRPILLLFFITYSEAVPISFPQSEVFQLQPIKISVQRREPESNFIETLPTRAEGEAEVEVGAEAGAQVVASEGLSYDPFNSNDTSSSFLTDFNNSTKRLKIQVDTVNFVNKFGPEELLSLVMRKIQNSGPTIAPTSKESIDQFLDFVENLIYNNAAQRIEKKLKLDFSKSKAPPTFHLHDGETETKKKEKKKFGFGETEFRRDAPALAQYTDSHLPHAILNIDQNDALPIIRQPIQPTKMMFFTQNDARYLLQPDPILQQVQEIRRSPQKLKKQARKLQQKQKISASALEKAIIAAEQNAILIEKLEDEKIDLRRKQLQEQKKLQIEKMRGGFSKKLPIAKLEERNMRRSPSLAHGQSTFNEKMFQLLEEYGIKTFRVETADFIVRIYADPKKTRFTSTSIHENQLLGPHYSKDDDFTKYHYKKSSNIRRKQQRPAFIYSRTISDSDATTTTTTTTKAPIPVQSDDVHTANHQVARKKHRKSLKPKQKQTSIERVL